MNTTAVCLYGMSSDTAGFSVPSSVSPVLSPARVPSSGMTADGTVRYGTVRYGTVRYGTVRYGTVRANYH